MKFRSIPAILFISLAIVISSCSKETVDVELFGDIEGIVIDSESDNPIPRVSLSTNPPSNSITSSNDGTFILNNLPVGNYTIQARKSGYSNVSVSVNVQEDRVANAQIVMVPEDHTPDVTEEDLEAEVTSWANTVVDDTTYVDVEYRLTNANSESDITEYEVYFEITTDGDTFYFDVSGSELKAGQNRHGNFRKGVRQFNATDVLVDGVWVSP
jgi:TolB protein